MNDSGALAGVGVAFLVLLALPVLALFALWLGMFIDVLMTKADVWVTAGHDRLFGLLLIVGLGPVGAILYGIFIRPQLARVERKLVVRQIRQAA